MGEIKLNHFVFSKSEHRVCFFENEKPSEKGVYRCGIKEYHSKIIGFFARRFHFAAKLEINGEVLCINRESFLNWVRRHEVKEPASWNQKDLMQAIQEVEEKLRAQSKPRSFQQSRDVSRRRKVEQDSSSGFEEARSCLESKNLHSDENLAALRDRTLFSKLVIALDEAGLLDEEVFEDLKERDRAFHEMAEVLLLLHKANLLNRENIRRIAEERNPEEYLQTMQALLDAKLLNQDRFDALRNRTEPADALRAIEMLNGNSELLKYCDGVVDHEDPRALVRAFGSLSRASLLDDTTAKILSFSERPEDMANSLHALLKAGIFDQNSLLAHEGDREMLAKALLVWNELGKDWEEAIELLVKHSDPFSLVQIWEILSKRELLDEKLLAEIAGREDLMPLLLGLGLLDQNEMLYDLEILEAEEPLAFARDRLPKQNREPGVDYEKARDLLKQRDFSEQRFEEDEKEPE